MFSCLGVVNFSVTSFFSDGKLSHVLTSSNPWALLPSISIKKILHSGFWRLPQGKGSQWSYQAKFWFPKLWGLLRDLKSPPAIKTIQYTSFPSLSQIQAIQGKGLLLIHQIQCGKEKHYRMSSLPSRTTRDKAAQRRTFRRCPACRKRESCSQATCATNLAQSRV